MTSNDLWCEKCKSQHHPVDTCPMDEKTPSERLDEEIIHLIVKYEIVVNNCCYNTFKSIKRDSKYIKKARIAVRNQIKHLCFAYERKRILEEIERKFKKRINARCVDKYHDDRWCRCCNDRQDAFWELMDDICKLLGVK